MAASRTRGDAAPGASAGRSRGFTLIELMVAMTIGVLVIGAVVMVFASTSRGRSSLERSSRLTENAHYALDFLSDELRVAGYFAEVSFVGVSWQVTNPCATALANLGWSNAPFTAPVGVAGYQATDPSPACVSNRKPNTPILVLRRVSVDTTPAANATVDAYLQVSKCNADPKFFVVSNQPADFTLHNIDCATIADIRRLYVRIYYIATCDVCGSDSIPTLKRVDLVNAALTTTPIVEGVENLAIEYGFDADGDGNPDRFLAFPDATLGPGYGDWSNVMAVRVYLLLRSTDTQPGYQDPKQFDLGLAGYTAPANDDYKRTVMSSVVRINNPAGQRETP